MSKIERMTMAIEFRDVKIVLLSGILISVDFTYSYDIDTDKTDIEVLETAPRIVNANMEELNDLFAQLKQYATAKLNEVRSTRDTLFKKFNAFDDNSVLH